MISWPCNSHSMCTAMWCALALLLMLLVSPTLAAVDKNDKPMASSPPSSSSTLEEEKDILPPPYPINANRHGPQDNSMERVIQIMRKHDSLRRQTTTTTTTTTRQSRHFDDLADDDFPTVEEFPIYNNTNETSLLDPVLTHSVLGEDMGFFSPVVRGHVYTLNNTLRHFSILEPLQGCGTHRVRTSATSKASHCVLATNAGFFNTRTGACLGNLVANHTVVQSPGTKNVNFGITHDGHYVIGYFDSEDVLNTTTGESRFQQLIGGVIWLVRDGESYVSASAEIEDMSTQETGPAFTTVKAPRISLGHDGDGRLMIVSVDGLDLYSFANLLISLGLKNAINLDGGGSVSVLNQGVMTNYPTDQCPESRMRCERAVTTITCIHRLDFDDGLPHCDPPNNDDSLPLSIEHIFAGIVIFIVSIAAAAVISIIIGIWIGSRRSNSRFTELKNQYEMAQLDEFDLDDALALQPSVPVKKVRISRDPPLVLDSDNDEL